MASKSIPYLNLYKQHQEDLEKYLEILKKTVETSDFVLGNNLLTFEKNYANYCETKYCAGVASGLDALTISLKALGVEKGDEVIVPSNTFIATVFAVIHAGASPVFVEPDLRTYNISASAIEKKITTKTKVIIPVHLYGQACEMTPITALARKHNIYVLEDNAQAHGATYNDRKTGSFGVINATSFYPGKNLGGFGDGGAITTNSKALYEKVKLLRNYGSQKKYYSEMIGYNSRLDSLQAAFLSLKLKKTNAYNSKRVKLAKLYLKELEGVGDLVLPATIEKSTHVFHIFCIRLKERDELQLFLKRKGIQTLIHYPIPPHLQKACKYLGFKKGDFPIAENPADTSLSLPLHPALSEGDVSYVISEIRNFFKK